jgi:hypothetical protein
MFGPYRSPRCRRADKLFCEMRGWVTIGGLDDAPVPWPYVMARGRHSPVLCGDLVRAVRTEAEVVVASLFGVRASLVWKWRRVLGVPHATPGTSERIAAAKRGTPRPQYVIDAMQKGRLPVSAATRAKLSEAS